MKKFIIFLSALLLLSFAQGVFAIECGSSLDGTSKMNESLHCVDSQIRLKSGTLNCNGHTINGVKENDSIGFLIKGDNDITIKNCVISNFTNGVKIRHGVETIGLGWGGLKSIRTYSRNTQIINTSFISNEIGILAKESYNSKIINSTFVNNSFSGIHFSHGEGSVLNNTFVNSNVSYKTTKGLSFCENGIDNTYHNSTGPTCSCTPVSKTSVINSPITLCAQKYPLENTLKLKTSSILDCNDAILSGKNTNKGILIRGAKDTTIKNCFLEGFSTGVVYNHDYTTHMDKVRHSNSVIKNSKIINVDNAVDIKGDSQKGKPLNISNSTLKADNYLIHNSNQEVIGKNNYYGTNNLSIIKEKISNPSKVQLSPIKTKTKRLELHLKNTTLNYTSSLQFKTNFTLDNLKFYSIKNQTTTKLPIDSFSQNTDSININLPSLNKENVLVFFSNKTHNELANNKKPLFKKYVKYFDINSSEKKYAFRHYPSKQKNSQSIVLAGGLWSSFSTWEKFAKELQKKGYNVYVIALTGETQECRNCYDYHFKTLKNNVLPQYLNTITDISNSTNITYIGHSNGARVVYEYLHSNANDHIDKIILMGMPGNFNYFSPVSSLVSKFNSSIIKTLEGKNHVGFQEILLSPIEQNPLKNIYFSIFGNTKGKISTSLYKWYHNLMILDEKSFPSLKTHKPITFIEGNIIERGDGVVAHKDTKDMVNKTQSDRISYYKFPLFHTQLSSHDRVLSLLISLI